MNNISLMNCNSMLMEELFGERDFGDNATNVNVIICKNKEEE